MSSNPPDQTSLDLEIERVIAHLADIDPDTEDYGAATNQLVKLHKLKMDEQKAHTDAFEAQTEEIVKIHQCEIEARRVAQEERPKRMSSDTLVLAASNLLGILVIVAYEQKHVFGSQAGKFIGKIR